MAYPFISGKLREAPAQPVELPLPERDAQVDPKGYLIDKDLLDAVNVALLLGQPLLLTGEPGTGKTQLAHRIAWELGYGKPLVFNTKSTSTARDLFYTFDTMGRFRDVYARDGANEGHFPKSGRNGSGPKPARRRSDREALRFITYTALGLAILYSRNEAEVAHVLPARFDHPGPRRSVVLIDEIDKAPRDFPNDLLHEVEAMSFRIPDLGNAEVKADAVRRPILVLTSNSERNLPDAFLRRCIFFNIPFPEERLADIVKARIPKLADANGAGAKDSAPQTTGASSKAGGAAQPELAPLLSSAIELFIQIRKQDLRKLPSTAELINWLQVLLRNNAPVTIPVTDASIDLLSSLSTLAKTREDAEFLTQFVKGKLAPR